MVRVLAGVFFVVVVAGAASACANVVQVDGVDVEVLSAAAGAAPSVGVLVLSIGFVEVGPV